MHQQGTTSVVPPSGPLRCEKKNKFQGQKVSVDACLERLRVNAAAHEACFNNFL